MNKNLGVFVEDERGRLYFIPVERYRKNIRKEVGKFILTIAVGIFLLTVLLPFSPILCIILLGGYTVKYGPKLL